MKLTLVELRTIETASKKVTKTCREGKMPKKRYSKRARAVAEAIEKSGLCNSSEVSTILEAVMGISLPPIEDEDAFFVKHAVVICTRCPNGHDYGRKPVLLLKDKGDRGLRMSGMRGNHLPSPHKTKSPIRYATNKEVVTFFKAIRQRVRDKKSVNYYS